MPQTDKSPTAPPGCAPTNGSGAVNRSLRRHVYEPRAAEAARILGLKGRKAKQFRRHAVRLMSEPPKSRISNPATETQRKTQAAESPGPLHPMVRTNDMEKQKCCKTDCGNVAGFEIIDTNEPRADCGATFACESHVGELLGSVPPTESAGPWSVSLLRPNDPSSESRRA